ncbi:MAG TPA: small acid-soluble spore protein SspJ [Bacillales bacterium]|nr:small acid-soluble spore protein SspJ [Bacillales bacterium]
MDLFGKNKGKHKNQESEKNSEAFQSSLEDAEQSLEGDELQKAVKQAQSKKDQ